MATAATTDKAISSTMMNGARGAPRRGASDTAPAESPRAAGGPPASPARRVGVVSAGVAATCRGAPGHQAGVRRRSPASPGDAHAAQAFARRSGFSTSSAGARERRRCRRRGDASDSPAACLQYTQVASAGGSISGSTAAARDVGGGTSGRRSALDARVGDLVVAADFPGDVQRRSLAPATSSTCCRPNRTSSRTTTSWRSGSATATSATSRRRAHPGARIPRQRLLPPRPASETARSRSACSAPGPSRTDTGWYWPNATAASRVGSIFAMSCR